jgi:DNA/RNA endonuclease G (NUC1)
MYKIVYDPNMGRANAFIMPNIDHRKAQGDTDALDYIKEFQVSVHVVEQFTGLEFFPDLPVRSRRMVTEQCSAMMDH